jgi:hypothetical protein
VSGRRVLELGCGLGLPSIAAARAGADVFYLQANVRLGLRLLPELVALGGEIWLADPRRAGTRDFLAAARARFSIATTEHDGAVAVHRLTARSRPRVSL